MFDEEDEADADAVVVVVDSSSSPREIVAARRIGIGEPHEERLRRRLDDDGPAKRPGDTCCRPGRRSGSPPVQNAVVVADATADTDGENNMAESRARRTPADVARNVSPFTDVGHIFFRGTTSVAAAAAAEEEELAFVRGLTMIFVEQ